MKRTLASRRRKNRMSDKELHAFHDGLHADAAKRLHGILSRSLGMHSFPASRKTAREMRRNIKKTEQLKKPFFSAAPTFQTEMPMHMHEFLKSWQPRFRKAESKHDRCVERVESNSPDVRNAHAVCVAEGIKPSSWKKSELEKATIKQKEAIQHHAYMALRGLADKYRWEKAPQTKSPFPRKRVAEIRHHISRVERHERAAKIPTDQSKSHYLRRYLNTKTFKSELEKWEPRFYKKFEALQKPYVSEAQRRWAHTSSGKEALGGEHAVHHWDEATKGKHLPEKVGKAGSGMAYKDELEKWEPKFYSKPSLAPQSTTGGLAHPRPAPAKGKSSRHPREAEIFRQARVAAANRFTGTNKAEEGVDDGPQEDDIFISPARPLGSRTSVSAGGQHIGVFGSDAEAHEAARRWSEMNKFWPNAWHVGDHGNYHRIENFHGPAPKKVFGKSAVADTTTKPVHASQVRPDKEPATSAKPVMKRPPTKARN
jgi:hypothetical protein